MLKFQIAFIAILIACVAFVACDQETEMLKPVVVGVPDTGIYWTDDTGKIQRADLDGSNVQTLVTGLGGQQSIAVDGAGGKIYWVDWYWSEPGNGKIQRANLDGTNVEDIVTNGLLGPGHIAVDGAGGKIYWTNDDNGDGDEKIQRANLDGTNVEDIVTNEELSHLNGIALDVTRGKVYWTDLYKIQRANLDGTNVEDVYVNPGFSNVFGLALDVAGGKLYWGNWGDRANSKIQRANLDGTNIEDLVTGLVSPLGIALDVAGRKMYWTDGGTNKIQRANLDGSNIEDLATQGLESPRDIAIGIFSPTVPPGADQQAQNNYGWQPAVPPSVDLYFVIDLLQELDDFEFRDHHFEGDVTPPQYKLKVLPEYPHIAKQAGVEGSIIIEAIIDENGIPQNIIVQFMEIGVGIEAEALVEAAAIEALRKTTFHPAMKDGKPIRIEAEVTYLFRLKDN